MVLALAVLLLLAMLGYVAWWVRRHPFPVAPGLRTRVLPLAVVLVLMIGLEACLAALVDVRRDAGLGDVLDNLLWATSTAVLTVLFTVLVVLAAARVLRRRADRRG